MLADMFKKAKFSIKNLAGTYVLTALQTKLSAVVDSPIKSLTRSTTYTTKTVVSVETLPEPGFLICTTAGTTAAAEPDYATLAEGEEITDGTAKFKAYFYGNMIATMVGATSVLAGTKGIVPAPTAGDEGKYLKGNGLWEAVLIASQAEAEAGLENTKTMTALRVAQALDAKTPRYIVEKYNNEQNWYEVYNDGWVKQGGVSAGTSGATRTISLLVPFTSIDYHLIICKASGNNSAFGINWQNKTTTTFDVYQYDGSNLAVAWIAEGYKTV